MRERDATPDRLAEPIEDALTAIAREAPSAGFTSAVMARVRAAEAPAAWDRMMGWQPAIVATLVVTLVSAGLLWRAGQVGEPAPKKERASEGAARTVSPPAALALPWANEPAAATVVARRPVAGIVSARPRTARALRVETAPDALQVPALAGPEPIDVGAIEIESLVPDPIAIEPLVIPEVDIERASRAPGSR